MVRFVAVDTLSGRILRPLYPTNWELGDPLREPGVGSLSIAKPQDMDKRAKLKDATRPRRRWVAAADDQGRWVWGGPIPKPPPPPGSEPTITVPLVDWRSWFYKVKIRPNADGSLNDYLVTNRDQTLIADDFFHLALDDTTPDTHLTPPPIIIDAPVLTQIKRRRTVNTLDGNLGEALDTLTNADPGIDWWTYVRGSADGDPRYLEIHVTSAWPERRKSVTPIRLDWQEGKGGNVPEVSWPAGGEAFTRVWGVGDEEPPNQAIAWDEDPEGDVLWEGHVGPLDGVKDPDTAYEHAYAERVRSKGRESHVEVTVLASQIPLGEIGPGDRVRMKYDDGWESVDVPAARIVSRTMTGGAETADRQALTLDLSDVHYPEQAGDVPGVPGEAD